jgi:hypothetical protein
MAKHAYQQDAFRCYSLTSGTFHRRRGADHRSLFGCRAPDPGIADISPHSAPRGMAGFPRTNILLVIRKLNRKKL